MSAALFDSPVSIAHSFSSDFKLTVSIAKQVREVVPTTYLEFGSKASKEKNYAHQISTNRFIYHLIAKPSFWHKRTYSSLRGGLEAILQHAQKHKCEKVSVPKLSAGLDKLNCLKVKEIITNNFYNSPIKLRFIRNRNIRMSVLVGLKRKTNKEKVGKNTRGPSKS